MTSFETERETECGKWNNIRFCGVVIHTILRKIVTLSLITVRLLNIKVMCSSVAKAGSFQGERDPSL